MYKVFRVVGIGFDVYYIYIYIFRYVLDIY